MESLRSFRTKYDMSRGNHCKPGNVGYSLLPTIIEHIPSLIKVKCTLIFKRDVGFHSLNSSGTKIPIPERCISFDFFKDTSGLVQMYVLRERPVNELKGSVTFLECKASFLTFVYNVKNPDYTWTLLKILRTSSLCYRNK